MTTLYFEDYDLSLRAAKIGRLAYVPSVRIRHAGAAGRLWKCLRVCVLPLGRTSLFISIERARARAA